MKIHLLLLFLIAATIVQSLAQSNGQPSDANEIIKAIYHHDSIFWEAYNKCDVETMAKYFTDDLEFYHDKSGPTFTLTTFEANMRTGLCGKADWRLRREPIEGTVKAFPMNNYGGVITGEHVFYINEAGKPEFLDGYGKFMQLWQFKNGQWKMSRIVSYDHGPAPYINKRKTISIAPAALARLTGEYSSSNTGSITITNRAENLKLSSKSLDLEIYPESETKFFAKERDLQFEFVTSNRRETKLIVYEKGNRVDEMIRK